MALIPHSHTDRMTAQAEKRRRLLAWLRLEIWTSPDIAGDVMRLAHATTIRNTLASMARDELITLDSIETETGIRRVIGITMEGQSTAAIGERALMTNVYQRGRVGLTVIKHTLDLQRLKLACLRAGWKNWTRPDSSKWTKNYRPDALARMPDGKTVCIECERTIKTKKRYKTVLANHLSGITKGAFQHVIYVSPTADKARNVERIFRSISTLEVTGETILVEPRIDAHFTFTTYENLPILKLNGTEK